MADKPGDDFVPSRVLDQARALAGDVLEDERFDSLVVWLEVQVFRQWRAAENQTEHEFALELKRGLEFIVAELQELAGKDD